MEKMGEGLKAVFIAGGAGTRLWPLSRERSPKQFHALAGEASLLRQTVERVLPVIPARDVWVVTGARYVERTRAELPEVPPRQVVGEEFRRVLLEAARAARETAGVIVGVRPTHPTTGLGYIRAGEALKGFEGAYRIAVFEEKPDAERARAFLEDGSYYWNPGMSAWLVSRLLELIRV